MKTDKYIKSIAISLAASASLGIATTAMADTIVVDCMGSGDYETLQEAADAAESGDTINVLPCTYVVDHVDGDVLIESKQLHIVSTDGPQTTFIEVDKIFSLIVSGIGPDVSLEGFTIRQSDAGAQNAVRQFAGELTITNCIFADNGRFADNGGAIYATDFDQLWVQSTRFESNHASRGGAIYAKDANEQGYVAISFCVFVSNEAINTGGALHLKDTSFDVFRCRFKDNKATTNSGGAIYYSTEEPNHDASISDSLFNKNTAENNGGAILISSSKTSVITENCSFKKNSTTAHDSYGGAVQVEHSYSRFYNCSFKNNQSYYAGAIDVYSSESSLVSCDFEKNKSLNGAGALNVEEATASLEDVTFAKNNAGDGWGGGAYSWWSTVEFTNVRFSKNKAIQGGGLFTQLSDVIFDDGLLEKNKATNFVEGSENIGGAIYMITTTINLKNLEVLKNKTGESIGGISLTSCAGIIGKCTIEDNQDHGLKLVDSPTVEIKKTTSCGNDAKDIKGDYIDEGDNTFCKE